MKKKAFSFLTIIGAVALLISAMPGDNPITKEGKVTVINTTTLASSVQGYVDATPLKIYISGNKVLRIEALPNKETPRYFQKVKKNLLGKWNGMTVNKALKAKVDGVTGATYSSDAVKKNVKIGLNYYKTHKK